MDADDSSSKQIRSLLTVLSFGVFTALFGGGLLLYFYTPSADLTFKRVVISPDWLKKSPGQEGDVQLFHRDFAKNEWVRTAVANTSFSEFYAGLEKERSLPVDAQEGKNAFIEPAAATLFIYTRDSQGIKALTQSIEFSSRGNYYRVKLLFLGSNGEEWAYFYHPGILQWAFKELHI